MEGPLWGTTPRLDIGRVGLSDGLWWTILFVVDGVL
jgi:hypothetical protein